MTHDDDTSDVIILGEEMAVKFLGSVVDGKLKSRKEKDYWFLDESGLYQVLLKANSKVANEFMYWVVRDVIPSIRKSGTFKLSAAEEIERKEIEANQKKIFQDMKETLARKEKELEESTAVLSQKNKELEETNTNLDQKEQQLKETTATLNQKEQSLKEIFSTVELHQRKILALENEKEQVQINLEISTAAETEIKAFVRSDPQRAAAVMSVPLLSPSTTRVNDPKYRALVHGAINAISFNLTTEWKHNWDRYPCMEEMYGTVIGVTDTQDFTVKKRHLCNPIALFSLLCSIMKKRLKDLKFPDHTYATQMPIYHLYTYVKNYNRFVADMGWPPMSLQQDIEKRFSPELILTFGFDNTNYPDEVITADLSSLYE